MNPSVMRVALFGSPLESYGAVGILAAMGR